MNKSEEEIYNNIIERVEGKYQEDTILKISDTFPDTIIGFKGDNK